MAEITLIAHNIRSTHNIGSLFRTAEGFGVKKILLSGYTPHPKSQNDTRLPHIADKLHAQIQKTALGAESLVDFEHYPELETWLSENQRTHSPLPIIGLEQTPASRDIRSFTPPSAFALLLGEEVNGIEKRYLRYCQQIVEIPMMGTKESFNVSVAVGIALYALT